MQENTRRTQENAEDHTDKAYKGLDIHSHGCLKDPQTCGSLLEIHGMKICNETENGERCPNMPEEPTFGTLAETINQGFNAIPAKFIKAMGTLFYEKK